MVDDYIYVNFPNGKQQLGVSKDIELEEPSEYIDPPRNLFNPDGAWRLDLVNDMRQSLGGEYYRRRRLIGTLIILDFLCSIALIILSTYDYFFSGDDTLTVGYYAIYIVYGVLDVLNDILGYVSLSKSNLTGISIFLVAGLILTGMAIVIFSPLVLFHILMFMITAQARNALARVTLTFL